MDEATKSKSIWGELEGEILKGKGIDIGCGPDPVTDTCARFDMEQGDANFITKFVTDKFDFVFSSHCLEHMFNPKVTILEWWQLVKDGGYLFFMVPDEDLYEQGVFPSRFNPDHKATFTISKRQSWSPKSINVVDLAQSLPNATILKLELQDMGYDRSLLRHGPNYPYLNFDGNSLGVKIRRKLNKYKNLLGFERSAVDQTMTGALAQIACILQKGSS